MSRQEQHETEDSYPLLPHERIWRQRDLLMVSISTTIATWCFLMGGFVGTYLNAKMGMAALTAGSMIGMFFISLAVIPAAAKYGIESVTSTKPFFGNRGWILALILQYLSVIGWNSIILIFFAKSTARLLLVTGVIPESFSSITVSLLTIAAVIAIFLLLRKGSEAVKHLSAFLTILILLVGIWLFFIIIKNFGFETIAAAKPAASSGHPLWDYTTGVEIGLVSLMAWWPYLGGLVRMSPKASQTTLPSMLGLGLPAAVMSYIGIFSILIIGDPDPTAWMVELGGILYGSIALGFIAVANFGSAVVGVYISCLGLRNVEFLKKKSWNLTTLTALIPIALVAVLIPDLFFAKFGNFLAFLGVLFAPMVGIQIVDYFVFRRKQLSMNDLYDSTATSAYSFWKGWNPAGLIALMGGIVTYFYLLNPLTYQSHPPYQYLTATLPSMIIAAAVYGIITSLVIIPAGWGGYRKNKRPKR
ncbi:purine-cytosine permease family protein [Bacillus sp. USDA818B3_A]|uniref:purine-cytosine permease family protein n=1 Tax=Bacillus sp. USDA818B3_A TaxID=2698834 RepID=UPI00136E2038|nr:cytosine permease [Bacillus sp. USDA818B3_A]